MPDTLGRLIFEFGARVRLFKNRTVSQSETIGNLTERDLAILEYVYDKGEASFAQIAQHLHMADIPRASTSAISQTITALYADKGLVEKRLNPQDQRQPIITLTEKGRQTVEIMRKVRLELLTIVKASMDLSETEAAIVEQAFARGIQYFDKLLAHETVPHSHN
ncbi:MAG: hypothetical protein JW860_15930 [Sedimentisphaerales bacterium]|nr:hypothetical protein [Sedimentisphaerales bacterium]